MASIAASGLAFLLLARFALVRMAAATPKHHIRRLFRRLDRVFERINERLAGGLVFGRAGADLPANSPIAWRESRRGNLGRVNYLVRVLLVLELPILIPTVAFVLSTRDHTFSKLTVPPMLLWSIAILVVLVRSCGLFARRNHGERWTSY